MSNSSGSVDRFMLGLNESKVFETLAPGGNELVADVQNVINQGIDGLLTSGGNANAVVLLETAEATAGTAASMSTNLTGATNNDLTFTARGVGVAGNSTTVTYSDPGGVSATLAISVVGTAIVISLGRATSAVNTTANDIKALVAGFAPAAALVSVADKAGNDGTGLVAAMTATALSGGVDAGIGTFSTAATLTVVPGGKDAGKVNVGRYCRIRNTGSGLATVVAKFLHRIQPYQYL